MDSYSSFSSLKIPSTSLLYTISSIITLLFTILKSIPNGKDVSSQTITQIVSLLCLLLPYSDYGITEWIELLLNCYSFVDIPTKIEVMKAIRILILQMNGKEKGVNTQSIVNRMWDVLMDCFSPFKTVSHVFQMQQEVLHVLRIMLTQSFWGSTLLSTIQTHIEDLDARVPVGFAVASIFGGELIGLFEGCQGVYYPKKPEVNEKTGPLEIYTEPEDCEVLQIDDKRGYMQIQIQRTMEILEVPTVSVDYAHPYPISLRDVPNSIVSWLVDMYVQIQSNKEPLQSELSRSITELSILKSLVALVKEMSAITLHNSSLMDYLQNYSNMVTKTPGLSVVPEMIHVVMSSIYASQTAVFSLSSSSSESDTPSLYQRWEMSSNEQEWLELSLKDSHLIQSILNSQLDNCTIVLDTNNKYLIHIPSKKLVNVFSGYDQFFIVDL